MQSFIGTYESISDLSGAYNLLEPVPMREPTPIPEEFQLRDLDICCGRGKGCWNHPGNQMFQKIIHASVERYSDAKTKNEKSLVVASIVEGLNKSGARFVKQDKPTGRWYDIGQTQARDKTGHAIRDYILNRSKREAKKRGLKKQTKRKSRTQAKRKLTNQPTKDIILTPNKCTSSSAQDEEQPFGTLSVPPIPLTPRYPCGLQQGLGVFDVVDLLVENSGKGIFERSSIPSQDLSAQEVLEVYELLSEEEDEQTDSFDTSSADFDSESPFPDDWY